MTQTATASKFTNPTYFDHFLYNIFWSNSMTFTNKANSDAMAGDQTGRSKRRDILKAIASVAAITSTPFAFAQPAKTYKLGISLAQSHPTVIGLQAACAEILAETKGLLAIEVFPSSQLGSDADMVSQVRSGAIDFVATAGGVWANLIPVAGITGAPFAFSSLQTAFSAVDGELGAHVRGEFAKVNLAPVGAVWDHGFRHITTGAKTINTVQDLAGLKLRVPATPTLQAMFKAMGAAPTTIGIGEVYTALQTKVVDGQENPFAIIEAYRFYEVQKYCALTGHAWECFWLVSNQRSWNTIAEPLRLVAQRVFAAQAVKTRGVLAAANTTLQADLTKRGMAFNSVNTQSFRESLQKAGTYGEFQSKFGNTAWALLEKYSGKLA
jgi:TRAP-type transport system periplasmic protein